PVTKALLPLSLQEHAPLSAEAIELIQEETAEIGLHCLIHIRDRNSLLEHLVPIYVDENLRRARGKLGANSRKLRSLTGRCQELLQILIEKLDRSTTSIL